MLDKLPKLTRARLRSWSKEYAAARQDKVELKFITGKEKLERIAEEEEIVIIQKRELEDYNMEDSGMSNYAMDSEKCHD
jgi:coproporphyrinogen III oxidase-like Fe-S oxidoreductase